MDTCMCNVDLLKTTGSITGNMKEHVNCSGVSGVRLLTCV